MHDDELPVDEATVRGLVERDLRGSRGRPLRLVAGAGSTNVQFRLGDDLLVRLPRQPGGFDDIAKEARWSAYLRGRLPAPLPEFVHVGEPGFGYPGPWAVTRWRDGRQATAPDDGRLAGDLAAFLDALQAVEVPAEALGMRWYRGGALEAVDAEVKAYAAQCRELPLELDVDACLRVWDEALGAPFDPTPRWVHGDLLAENLLVRDGRLAAVLDLGALSVGNPDVDLVVAWEVLPRGAREEFRDRLGVTDASWLRGRAWALGIALMTFPYYWSSLPARCADRLVLAREALAG